MIKKLVHNWFGETFVQEQHGYSLSGSIVSRRKHLITGNMTVLMRVLVCLHGDEINFESMKKAVQQHPDLAGERVRRINCNWIVLSEHGGIYLYEILAVKEHVRCSGMRNRFLVINSDTGSFSFGPGHVLNREYTETMQDLLARMKSIPPAVCIRKFESIMDSALADMEK